MRSNSGSGKSTKSGKISSLEPTFCPSVIVLSEIDDGPPSYQSLFDNPKIVTSKGDWETQSPNYWLHPNSAYPHLNHVHTSTDSAVLYL